MKNRTRILSEVIKGTMIGIANIVVWIAAAVIAISHNHPEVAKIELVVQLLINMWWAVVFVLLASPAGGLLRAWRLGFFKDQGDVSGRK